ncbi:MAG: DUF554 domain-containing protein [Coriobacteriia bacterium]|nr:DUF554 domain-containing protein [Coriobacteriia bacterium]
MRGEGVLVNVIAILVGTGLGLVFGRLISERFRAIAFTAIGMSTMIIGAAMSIGGLNALGDSHLGNYAALVLVGSLAIGSIIGEAIGIERHLERFGHFLQAMAARTPILAPAKATEPGEKGHTLVEGFVTASLLFCVGAMTVLGSLQDGLGDPSLLYLKSLLDGIASVALATTLGVGVGLSVIPVIVIQGSIAAGAVALEPLFTPVVIDAIRAAGGALILAIGLDLTGIKRLPVGNMLPAIVVAALLAGWLG